MASLVHAQRSRLPLEFPHFDEGVAAQIGNVRERQGAAQLAGEQEHRAGGAINGLRPTPSCARSSGGIGSATAGAAVTDMRDRLASPGAAFHRPVAGE